MFNCLTPAEGKWPAQSAARRENSGQKKAGGKIPRTYAKESGPCVLIILSSLLSSHQTVNADGTAAIARLIRRVCLLREQGNHPGADEMEASQLAAAVLSS